MTTCYCLGRWETDCFRGWLSLSSRPDRLSRLEVFVSFIVLRSQCAPSIVDMCNVQMVYKVHFLIAPRPCCCIQRYISERTLLVLHVTNLIVIVVFPCVVILNGQPSPGESHIQHACSVHSRLHCYVHLSHGDDGSCVCFSYGGWVCSSFGCTNLLHIRLASQQLSMYVAEGDML